MKKKPSKSLRKYIRKEKARIRREVLDFKEQEKLINQLYRKFYSSSKSALNQQQKSSRTISPDQR